VSRLVVRGALAAAALPLLGLVGCSEGDPGADGDVESLGELVPSPLAEELTETGRCGTFFWATDGTGSLAVVVDPGVADEATLPSEEVEVAVHHDADPCEVSADGDGSRGVAGRVEVERDADGCATAVSVDGLEAADGTTFGPIEIAAPCA
jgi:hypothetical protein